MKIKVVLWYLGVILTAVSLGLAIMFGSWVLSIVTLVLAMLLRATNKHIPLPKVYQSMGMKNETFEGR